MSVRTLEELGQLLETSAAESAQTNKLLNDQVIPELARVKEMVTEAGLNGHTALLKKFLDEYAVGQSRAQSYAAVRADLKRRFGFLTQPKAWLRALFYAAIGGLGWRLISSAHIPFLH